MKAKKKLSNEPYSVVRFLWVSAPVKAKLCTFTLEYTHFIFNLCPIYTNDSANAKFSTNSQETDYSVRKVDGHKSAWADRGKAVITSRYWELIEP